MGAEVSRGAEIGNGEWREQKTGELEKRDVQLDASLRSEHAEKKKSRERLARGSRGRLLRRIPPQSARMESGAESGSATWSPFGTPVGAMGDPPVRSPRGARLDDRRRSAMPSVSPAASRS